MSERMPEPKRANGTENGNRTKRRQTNLIAMNVVCLAQHRVVLFQPSIAARLAMLNAMLSALTTIIVAVARRPSRIARFTRRQTRSNHITNPRTSINNIFIYNSLDECTYIVYEIRFNHSDFGFECGSVVRFCVVLHTAIRLGLQSAVVVLRLSRKLCWLSPDGNKKGYTDFA